jgi:hypothetical protein
LRGTKTRSRAASSGQAMMEVSGDMFEILQRSTK